MKKRILAMLLVLVMLVGILPVGALAAEEEQTVTDPCTVTEGCTFAAGHEGNCSNFVPCENEGCEFAAGHEGNCSNFVACENEGCEFAAGHEGNCSNFVACENEGCEFAAGHEGNCSNFVACETEGCQYAANHEGSCSNAVALIDDVEPAADAVVYVTINNAGTLALANASVTATDINADGALTYEEALIAAHKAYCASGENGYYAQQSEYGSFVTTLWGVETDGSCYFFKNNVALDYGVSNTEYSTVTAGDRIYAAILADATGWSDWYTYFDKTSLTVDAGTEFTLTLNGFAAMSYGTVTTSAVSGVSVGTWSNGTFTALSGKTTDSNGKVTLSFDTAGTYYISASGSESGGSPIMPPVCVVSVKAKEVPAESIALDAAEASLKVGGTMTLTATVTPENSTDSVTWRSSDETVAKVDDAGVVTAVAAGTATITATAGSSSAECVVTVSSVQYLSSLIVKLATSETASELLEDGAFEYTISAPANKTALYVTATVSDDAPADSTITATYTKQGATAATTVQITKANTALSGALPSGITEGLVTITVGTDEDAQTYTLNVSRTVAIGTATFKDAEGNSLSTFNSQYLVPQTLETINITVNSYGGALTINGQTATDSEAYVFTPQWDENNECVVTTTSTYNGEDASNQYTLKRYLPEDSYTGSCGTSATWTLTNGVLTISGTGAMKAYTTSSRPTWKPFESSIQSVVIEEGITDVGKYAFYNLTALESVTMADTVTTVNQYAFSGCTGLVTATLSSGITKIDNYAFRYCESLTTAELPASLKTLGTYAFSGCSKLSEVTIPATLTTIGNRAFENCASLKTVEIPSTVTSVGTYVFSGCTGLESVVLKGAVGKYMFNGCTSLNQITLDGPTTLVGNLFSGCTALETVTIPEGVTAIDDYAFNGCTGLTSVSIPSTVTSLSALAFYGCTNLKSITFAGTNYVLNNGIVYTGDGTTLVLALNAEGNVSIPEGVTTISDNAFYGNTGLTGITLPSTLVTIGEGAFCGCEKLSGVTIPASVTQIGDDAFKNNTSLTSIAIPEGVTVLSDSIFRGCTALRTVSLPSTLVTMETSAFYGCSALESIVIPEGVTTMGTNMFIGCEALASVSLPSTLTSIGSTSFSGCTSLTYLEIPEGVTTVPQLLLTGCTAMETVVLPASITTINKDAFKDTTALKVLGFRGTPEQWAAITINADIPIPVTYYYGRTDAPVVAEHPVDIILQQNSTRTDILSVTAQPQTEGLSITFTWYRNAEDSNSGGTVVEGTTVSEDGLTSYCTPLTDELGTSYYYCVLTTVSGEETLSVPSETARVDVREYAWDGNGTAAKPYLLPDADSLQALYNFVAAGESTEGLYFEITADITLPDGWAPIGVLIDPSLGHINSGKNMYAFSGTLDGGYHTVTVPEGGLPLFGYVKGATVKKLNIYGTKIAGYGLVNNYEGVGLSGSAVVIEEVTLLSGTQTLKSGLIGTYITNNGYAGCSGSYVVTIRNCTVQENVVIGYNRDQKQIGSIAGRINGTIENCTSAATVYGTDYVGGILGNRDNAMSTCSVTGCTFTGTVEATGEHVGGIVGGGYDNSSAPNGVGVSITNCAASGSVTGSNKVGGIYGGETYVAQTYENAAYTISGNTFTGTVSATGGSYAGGVIGYLCSLNRYANISDNYYASGCNASKGIGFVQYVDTSCETHESESGAVYFSTAEDTSGCPSVYGCAWKTAHNRTDDPLGADAANLCYTDAGADPVNVTVTVSNKGTLALVNGAVTVKDTNQDGILTYHEALEAAHAAYCPDGYTATESEWGISVSEIWGVETYNSLYFRNGEKLANHVGNTETSTVAEGDSLLISVNKDDTYYSDRYSSFNLTEKTVVAGVSFKLTLKAELTGGSTIVPNATIGIWKDGVFTPIEGMATGEDGNVKLTFDEVGTYIISASGTVSDTVQDWSNGGAEVTADCPIIAPVCVVKVLPVPYFSDAELYTSADSYQNGDDPLEITPDFDGNVRTGYSVVAPDYQNTLYLVATISEETMENGWGSNLIMVSNNWGGWGGAAPNGNLLTRDAYFEKGYVSFYFDTGAWDEYQINVNQYTTLKKLVMDGVWDQEFNPDTTAYHVYVDGGAESISITPTSYKSTYTITVNGTAVTSGSEHVLTYNWDDDGKMKVEIIVSADGLTSTTYALELEKKPLNDTPFILKHPVEADYTVIDTSVEALRVDASANGELSYQWYWNTTDSNENGTIIDGATESTYTPPITEDVIGTRYYYCVVTNVDKTEENVTVSNTARVTVDPDPTPVVRITNPGTDVMPDDGIAYLWDTGYYYHVGDEATELVVEATSAAPGGRYSYQWYGSNYGYGGNWNSMTSTDTNSTYTPATSIDKANETGIFYMCKVTYTYKGKTYESWSTTGETFTDDAGVTHEMQGAYVFLKASEAPAPVINTQPKSATYVVGDQMSRLSVSVGWSSGVSTSYQWYVSETDSTENGVAIEGATSSWYSDLGTATEPGTKYYYCVITNTLQGLTASVTSDMAVITINSMEGVLDEKLEGTGTVSDPYLIADAEDYQTVADVVASGIPLKDVYLKQVADITLPAGWKPIGVLKDPSIGHISSGDNVYAFSGNLDGGGYTLTIPEGGLPLLGYVNGATVSNLNIYGKQIAGYGLVNNLEGVGLSGEAICIDNVNLLSGTQTLKAGLIGTYITNNGYAGCSAGYYVTIKNCTIQEGVVIGYNKDQSMIGSFAGRVNGTIDNCVSYATVYGTDYVGGILGTRDNAMGTCAVTNSKFYGTVEATGQHVGGIVGGGYCNSSAPNGVKITITNCSASGSVTGADKVGGILGGDTYVAQVWNAYTFKNNAFTGTVKATSGTYVGGIIGFYDSLNKVDDITGNYYSSTCGADKGIGFVQYVDTNSATHETSSGATYINTETSVDGCPNVTGCGWRTGYNRTDDPLGADAAKLCYTDSTPVTATELKVSGTYKTEFTTGDKLDLTGIVLTVVYSDKSEKTISLSDAAVTGYDADKVGEQELTISYNGLTAFITVTVKNPEGTIKVTVSVYGDSAHGDNGTVHTLSGGGLTAWVSGKIYEVDSNATVWDVLQQAFKDNGITYSASSSNSQGTVYISSLTRNGVTLAEFTNGSNSGWMYTLNGVHPLLGVAQQYLKDGDKIIFHYSDDYTKEEGSSGNDENKDAEAAEKVEKLIDAIGTVTLNKADEIEAARKAYDALTYAQKQLVENYATLTAAEAQYAKLKAADDEKKAEAVEDLIDSILEGSTAFENDVKAAQAAYYRLTADQRKLVDNYYKLAKYLKKLADEEDKEAAEEVEKLIEDLGTITLDSEEAIQAAREAYDKLNDEQKSLVENLDVLEAAEEKLAELKADAEIQDIYKTTGDYIESLGTPSTGSVGGEWMVIGLTRSGREVPGVDDYYASVVRYVQENIDENERLHSAKSTDNSRIILALTALGYDVTDVDGHNLLTGLNDMAFVQKQGLNGPIWALIALDSGNYPVPEGDVTREALIQVILDAQLADGGWALSGETSDPDMTGMAVQALAPYYETNADVKKAVDEAIETMSRLQNADGSYSTYGDSGMVATSESTAQIIVALAALGIDADKDARFTKNGISAVEALCAYYVEGGGFKHLMDNVLDGMATEQGYYALVSYFRMLNGETNLYDMTDVVDLGGDVETVETEPTEETLPVTEPVEVREDGSGFPWWIIIVILAAGVAVAVAVPVFRKKNGAR